MAVTEQHVTTPLAAFASRRSDARVQGLKDWTVGHDDRRANVGAWYDRRDTLVLTLRHDDDDGDGER